jgi:hypothetical protein
MKINGEEKKREKKKRKKYKRERIDKNEKCN